MRREGFAVDAPMGEQELWPLVLGSGAQPQRVAFSAAQQLAAADAATPRLTGRPLSQAFGLATLLGYHRRAAELNRWAVFSSLLEGNHERRPSFNTRRSDSSTSSWFVSGSASRLRHMVISQRTPRARSSTKLLHISGARRVLRSGSAASPPSPRPTGAALNSAPRRKGAALSVKQFRPCQRVPHAKESVMFVFSNRRAYDSRWS